MDHDGLKTVLLTEVGIGGLDNVEELGNDGGHTTEEARTSSTFANAITSLNSHISKIFGGLGIHNFGGGSEDSVTAGRSTLL